MGAGHPYIPYVGARYFDAKPKVLIYAMAQNLAGRKGQNLIREWHQSKDKGLRRQYRPDKMRISVHPYETGHLKVIASLVLNEYPGTNYIPSDNVHERIAVTNFVKFSFFKQGKNNQLIDANPPLEIYDEMWKYYSAYEIDLLQPDIVVGVGSDVTNAIKRNLHRKITLIKIPFPGRLNLNSRYIPKGKRLKEQGHYYASEIEGIRALLRGTPDDGTIAKAIEMDWCYFKEMKTLFKEVLVKK